MKKIVWGFAIIGCLAIIIGGATGVAYIEQSMANAQEESIQEVLNLSELSPESAALYYMSTYSCNEELENLACQQAREEYEQEIEDIPLVEESVIIEDIPLVEESVIIEDIPLVEEPAIIEDIPLVEEIDSALIEQVEAKEEEVRVTTEPIPGPPAPVETGASTFAYVNPLDEMISNGGSWSTDGLTSVTTTEYEYDSDGRLYEICRTEWYDDNGNCVSCCSSIQLVEAPTGY